jgi:hypothetical protein
MTTATAYTEATDRELQEFCEMLDEEVAAYLSDVANDDSRNLAEMDDVAVAEYREDRREFNRKLAAGEIPAPEFDEDSFPF